MTEPDESSKESAVHAEFKQDAKFKLLEDKIASQNTVIAELQVNASEYNKIVASLLGCLQAETLVGRTDSWGKLLNTLEESTVVRFSRKDYLKMLQERN